MVHLVHICREFDTVFPVEIVFSKEPKIQDNAGISPGSTVPIREGVAVDLDMVFVLFVIPNHELNVRIFKRNRETVIGVFFLVLLDLFCIIGVPFDVFDDPVAEDNLWKRIH